MPVATMNTPTQKILVVDDEPDILKLVQVILEGTSEWSVLCAESSSAALDMARREHPAAILLDARMPGDDGFTTLARLHADPDTTETPVILMTALAQRSNPSVPPGFAGVIAKPFDPLKLPQQIRSILSAKTQLS
jgi:CheY-like chemotaxis protein